MSRGTEPVSSGCSRPKVMIVDDNCDIVRVIERLLATEGYELVIASDGDEALHLARREIPDLILLDIMLPKRDGLTVCRELKAEDKTKGIMIILVTGRASIDQRVQGFEAGADDYIPKPFHVPELLARTQNALRLKRLTDDLEDRNRKLLKSQNDLVRSEKMATIGLLASGIAHEFNNIMAGIAGYAQVAKTNSQYQALLVDVALTQTERAFELTRSLSTYNRVQEGERRCNVGVVISETLTLLAKKVEQFSVQVTKSVEQQLSAQISPGQLQEVLLNLILNGVHATSGSDRRVNVTARATADGEGVEILVTDNGQGIPEADVERIFDPFFTTKGALGGGNQLGVGLGLTVTYNVVQSHRGTISVTSKVGEGTTFRVVLPKAAAGDMTPEPASPETDSAPVRDGPLSILVVDDEKVACEWLEIFLEGHDVVCCVDPLEALNKYRDRKFDYVILDVCIPGPMNGFGLFDELEKVHPEARVVFASGAFPDDHFRSYIARAHGHLIKPFDLRELAGLLGLRRQEALSMSTSTAAG